MSCVLLNRRTRNRCGLSSAMNFANGFLTMDFEVCVYLLKYYYTYRDRFISPSHFLAVLVLYLTSILRYDEDESTIIYHMIVFLAYFSPLFGAILSDSYLGKFKYVCFTTLPKTKIYVLRIINYSISLLFLFFNVYKIDLYYKLYTE